MGQVRPESKVLLVAAATMAVITAVAYEIGLFWTQLGPLPRPEFWLLIGIGGPLAVALFGPQGRWSKRVSVALFAIGVAASVLAVHGVVAGVRDVVIHTDTSGYYFGFEYAWESNTLRYGMTESGDSYPYAGHPNRLLVLVGTVAMASGIYSRLPRRWFGEPNSPRSADGLSEAQ